MNIQNYFREIQVLILLLICQMSVQSQMPDAISISPENATVYDEITLTFDPALACFQNGSLAGLSSVAMHSGLTVNGTAWQYVVEFNSLGGNGQSPVLTANPDGTYSITFTPYEFYEFPIGSTVTQICAVFNNGTDWNQDGRDFIEGGTDCTDFFIPILTGSAYEPGLNSIVPNHGFQGETVNVQIFGVNTNFVNGSTQIWIEKDLVSNFMNSYYVVNDTLISATLVIPEDAETGSWSLYVNTPINGLMDIPNAFLINSEGGTMPTAITIEPPNATAYDEITMTFNPEESCFIAGSLTGASQVYIHSGVALYSGEVWQYVVDFSSLGANGQSAELTDNGDGTWSITYIPSEFYGFGPGLIVTNICGVFNNGTWDFDGRDFEEGTVNCTDFFIPLNFSTGADEYPSIDLSITPNPATDIITITTSGLKSGLITDMIGQPLIEIHGTSEINNSIDIKSLLKGIYIISISDYQGNIVTEKFIKK
jgi:hypothetical protein